MRPKGTRKAVAGAVALIVLVGGLSATIAIPAMAQDPPKVWVGPDCPGGDYVCRGAGPVHQVSTGAQDLEIVCTAADCSGLAQENVSGNSLIVCDQDAEVSGATLSCGRPDAKNQQTSHSGTTTFLYTQTTTLDRVVEAGLNDVAQQTGSQIVVADIQNGSGQILIGNAGDPSKQEVLANALTKVSATADLAQQFEQLVNITAMSGVAGLLPTGATAGNADAFSEQSQTLTSTLRAAVSSQRQNSAGHPQNPGQGDQDYSLKMYSTTGVVNADIKQFQNFTATCTLPLIDFARNCVQQVGNGNPATNATGDPQGKVFLDLDSDEFAKGVVNQEKNFKQFGEPLPCAGSLCVPSVVTQDILDQFDLGSLFGHTATELHGNQKGIHENKGDRVCELHGQLDAKILSTIHQNCTMNLTEYTNDCEGEDCDADLVCPGSGPQQTGECTVQESHGTQQEVIGTQGLGQGYWKVHPLVWQDAQPDDEFVEHFSQGALHPALASPTTLHQAISSQGGGNTLEGAATNLARQAVAAYLNALHDGVDYALLSTQVVQLTNAALAGTREDMVAQANQFETYNQAGCTEPDCPPA